MAVIKNKSKGNIFSKKEMLFVVAFFFFILALLVFTFFSPNLYKSSQPINIEVKKGHTLTQIVDSLFEKGIIPSKTNMKIAVFIYGAERKLKAGRYNIPNGLSYLQLVELFIEGSPSEEVLISIGEGIWQKDLAKLLKEKLNIDSSRVMGLSRSRSFLNSLNLNVSSLEGYLLPETYYFYSNSNAEEVLNRLYGEMKKIFADEKIQAEMKNIGMNMHQVLTLASIIEGESNLFSEFKTISGVYHNRLKKRMLLQADPTIQYLIRDRRKNKIFYKDLEIDSKFNTYKYPGLPPAPINNPGKQAILAALFPEHHNYYYFVANGQGGHNFAISSKEHIINVAKYRQWRAEQN
ncbi:MAG: endolytic transglycosylase MltG [Ignavibacteria bacterium]|nr:endolytic transglycosylase MltG [Ignavibacteria bacterium]